MRIEGLVSVIVPVYNRPALLIEAVESAVGQDHRPLEVLIVDDGSTDCRTPEAAAALAARFPDVVSVHRIANGGPGAARERGRQGARGEFIQYLDSDDLLLPGKLSAQVSALRRAPHADAAYGITLYRGADGHRPGKPHKGTGIPRDALFPTFLNERWWDTSTPLYRRSTCDRAGAWTRLRIEEDWEYDCRIAALGGRIVHCPVPVSETRDHGSDRLCRVDSGGTDRLRDRAQAHALVWGHALTAGLPESAPAEVARFSRSLFLLARQCGAAGLAEAAEALLALAGEAAASVAARTRDIAQYRALARWLGHRPLGRLSGLVDRVRAAARGHA